MRPQTDDVIIDLPRTPANAWLFEPIENHPEIVKKEKKTVVQTNALNEGVSHSKED